MPMCRSELNGLRQFDNLRFSVSDLSSALFHIKNIEAFEARHPELFQKGKPPQPVQGDTVLEAQLAQARQEIECLTQEVEHLKAGDNGGGAEPVVCATCRADSSHSDEWTRDVECAVSFACDLMQAGERGSTDYHEAEWKTRRGAPRKRAFEAFRRALHDHLKEADPKKKLHP